MSECGCGGSDVPFCVHDCRLRRWSVDWDARRLVLHVHGDHAPHELVDIVFEGLIAHHFEHDGPDNIIEALAECDLDDLLADHRDAIERGLPFGWPKLDAQSFESLGPTLRALDVHAFELDAVLGMAGWVLARSIRFERLVEPGPTV